MAKEKAKVAIPDQEFKLSDSDVEAFLNQIAVTIHKKSSGVSKSEGIDLDVVGNAHVRLLRRVSRRGWPYVQKLIKSLVDSKVKSKKTSKKAK
jgi:hypothetical protein